MPRATESLSLLLEAASDEHPATAGDSNTVPFTAASCYTGELRDLHIVRRAARNREERRAMKAARRERHANYWAAVLKRHRSDTTPTSSDTETDAPSVTAVADCKHRPVPSSALPVTGRHASHLVPLFTAAIVALLTVLAVAGAWQMLPQQLLTMA